MKQVLELLVDSDEPDLGVTNAIEAYRDLFERPRGREEIAKLMEALLGDQRAITRQMVERWFSQKNRVTPSGILLVALLTSCAMLKKGISEIESRQRQSTDGRKPFGVQPLKQRTKRKREDNATRTTTNG